MAIEAHFSGRLGKFALDAAFALPNVGVTGLFGPSGCGKTTMLRCLAGLTRLKGTLAVEGETWQDAGAFLPPHRRPIGYVFQEPRLFPHLTVRQNLLYGYRRSAQRREALGFEEVTALMGVGAFIERPTGALSGGEKQRVAVARALLSQPRLLLMDEPLSALDRDARAEILPYLESLHRAMALPVVYVTHEFAELERLADHLVLMEKGAVLAAGPFADLVTDLALPIARRPDSVAALDVMIDSYDEAYDLTVCRLGALVLSVPGRLGSAGAGRRVLVRAGDVSLVKGARPMGTSLLNILPARVLSAEIVAAGRVQVLLSLEGVEGRLLAGVTRKSWDMLQLAPGDAVFAQVKGVALADLR